MENVILEITEREEKPDTSNDELLARLLSQEINKDNIMFYGEQQKRALSKNEQRIRAATMAERRQHIRRFKMQFTR